MDAGAENDKYAGRHAQKSSTPDSREGGVIGPHPMSRNWINSLRPKQGCVFLMDIQYMTENYKNGNYASLWRS